VQSILMKPLVTGLTVLLFAIPATAKDKGDNSIPPAAVAWNPPSDEGHGDHDSNGGNGNGHEDHGNGNGFGHDGPPMGDPGDPVSPTLPHGLSKRDELPPGLAKRDELPPGLAKRFD
jgi:hypothetical protein